MKIGLIGVGGMGGGHLNIYKNMKDIELVACDIRLDMLKEKIGDLPIRCYADMDELIRVEKPDVVDICTPTYLHAEQVIKALESGAHVLSEKPMGISSKACEEILSAIKRTGKTYMTAQVVRFMNAYAYLRGIIESGKKGRLESLTMRRFSQTPLWSFENWYLDEKKSAHVVFDLMIHDIDFMQSVLGQPRDIIGVYHPMTDTMSNYVFANYVYDGCVASLESGWYNGQKVKFAAEYKAVFENGNLVFKDDVLYDCNEKVDFSGANKIGDIGINISNVDGYAAEIIYFLECVRGGKACSMVTPESSAATIALAERTLKELTRV